MWPFNKQADEPPKPQGSPFEQLSKPPGWYDEPRESKKGARADYRLAASSPTPAATNDTPASHNSTFLDPDDAAALPVSSTSLRNMPRPAAPISRGFVAPSQPDTNFAPDDPLFDSKGQFNPNHSKMTTANGAVRNNSPLGRNAAGFHPSANQRNQGKSKSKFQGNSESDYPDDGDSDSDSSYYNGSKPTNHAEENTARQSLQQQQQQQWRETTRRVGEANELQFQQELAEDSSLWSQKDNLKSKQTPSLEERIAPHNMQGKRLFRRFNTSEARPDNLDSMYNVDADGLPTTALSFGHWDGVPSPSDVRTAAVIDRSQIAKKDKVINPTGGETYGRPRSHVRQNLPPNVTQDGRKFVVKPPVPVNPNDFAALPQASQTAYQDQLLDYQKFSFRGMNQQQRELMLLAQWDKLTVDQQEECREFQYLHLNFNTRKRVKHMTAAEREEFLRFKHFDQQRIFLLQPLSFEIESDKYEADQFVRDDDEADFYLEGYPNPRAKNAFTQGVDRLRDIHTQQRLQHEKQHQSESRLNNTDRSSSTTRQSPTGKYDNFIVKKNQSATDGQDDPDGLSSTILDLESDALAQPKYDKDGKPILNWQDIIRKYQDSKTQPTEEDLELIHDQLRNLTPQQQFNILFRQHEKQLQELERFHNAQLKRATNLKVDQLQKNYQEDGGKGSIPAKQLIPLVANDKDMDILRRRQNYQRSQLLKKQETEHKQLTHVLLVQDQARKEHQTKQHQLEVAKYRDREANPLSPDQEDEIEKELRMLNQFQPTFKPTGRPLEDEIAQKRKELLWRKQEEEVIKAQKDEALRLAQLEEKDFQERNRLQLVQRLEDGRERREIEYTLVKQRGKMLDLKMPLNARIYRPHHRYLDGSTRKRDPRAAYMYKTLGMLLFGVNVRWNGGIINGLLSTMVPVGKIPDPVDDQSQSRGYYVDIEHRNLDFSNLYNYYGVAAALYNPSIIPSFSHALYENPDLDPMTNPNVVGFDEYERTYREHNRRAYDLEQQRQAQLLESDDTRFDVPLSLAEAENQEITATPLRPQSPQQFAIDPAEYERIQDLKLREYQQSHQNRRSRHDIRNEMVSNTSNDEQPLSSLQLRPDAIINDPFLSTPALLPVNMNDQARFNPFVNGRPLDEIQLDDPEVDQWVESILKFQEDHKSFQQGLQSQTPEARRIQINELLPTASFIDDKMQSESQFTQLKQKLVSSMEQPGATLQEVYNQLVYNANLSPQEKSELYDTIQRHQRTTTMMGGEESNTDEESTDDRSGQRTVSPHELRARKENTIGRSLLENSARHRGTSNQFNKTEMISRDEMVNWTAADLAEGGFDHPVFNKAVEMQMSQHKQRAQRGGGRGFKTDIDADVEFFDAHLKWDSDPKDDNNSGGRFGREQYAVHKKPDGLPQWTKDQQSRAGFSDDEGSGTDLDNIGTNEKLDARQSRSYWANRTTQQQNTVLSRNNQKDDPSGYTSARSGMMPTKFVGSPQELPTDLTREDLQSEALLRKHNINLNPPSNNNLTTNLANQDGGGSGGNGIFSTAKGFFGGLFG